MSNYVPREASILKFSRLDNQIELHQNIPKVYRDEKTVVVGPQGGKFGMIVLDIMTTFSTSKHTMDDVSHDQIPKEKYLDLLAKLPEELENTKPELTICRFWARKI